MSLPEGCIETCPGCAHRNLTLDQSLHQKETWLKKVLASWVDYISDIQSVEHNDRWNYRGKVCLNTQYIQGSWKFGMLKRDELIAIPQCPVHTPQVRATIALLEENLPSWSGFPMAFYHHTHAQVCLILKTRQFPDVTWYTRNFEDKLKKIGVEGLSIHLHPAAGRRLFDKGGWYQLYGRNFSFDKNGLIYGNTSFHQLIDKLYQHSLDLTADFFSTHQFTPLVDLYCGRGVGLSQWVKNNRPAIGIESGAEAVTCARINAPEATVFLGTCERRIPQLEAWRQNQIKLLDTDEFLLYTNPPRTGMEPLVTEWITDHLHPQKIAYLSCSAGTLKKDLTKLCQAGYKVKKIIPFDFFPQTYHVECLVFLSLQSESAGM